MDFDFTINDKLSSDLILSKVSEESIMCYYLGLRTLNKKLFRSPLRSDKNPTCSIYRNNRGKLIFKDFATGQYLDCWNVVMTLYHCTYKEALKIIARDFGIIKDNHVERKKINLDVPLVKNKEISKIQVEVQDFTELELKWWDKYGITLEILKKFNVYSCKSVFLNGELIAKSQQHCPIFGYYGGKIKENGEKVELWKCYFPKRTSYRFLGNWPSKKIQGYEQLPKTGKICIITKAMKDVMALYAYGIPACAPNSEVIIPPETIINDLTSRFDNVFVLWDNDQTGITFLNKIKRKYPQLKCLIIPRRLEAKDFSDLRAKYGYTKTKEFIIEYLKSIK